MNKPTATVRDKRIPKTARTPTGLRPRPGSANSDAQDSRVGWQVANVTISGVNTEPHLSLVHATLSKPTDSAPVRVNVASDDSISVRRAAELVLVSESTLRRWMATGRLKRGVHWLKVKGRIQVNWRGLRAWFLMQRAAARTCAADQGAGSSRRGNIPEISNVGERDAAAEDLIGGRERPRWGSTGASRGQQGQQ